MFEFLYTNEAKLITSDFCIEPENFPACLVDLQKFANTFDDPLYKNLEKCDDIYSFMWPFGWEPRFGINRIYFSISTIDADTISLLQVIAPFVKKGSFIEMKNHDGNHWRWLFDGGKICLMRQNWELCDG